MDRQMLDRNDLTTAELAQALGINYTPAPKPAYGPTADPSRPAAPPAGFVPTVCAVAEELWCLPTGIVLSANRCRVATLARHACLHLTRTKTTWPSETIGRLFNRNHSAVIRACQRIEARDEQGRRIRAGLLHEDRYFAQLYRELERRTADLFDNTHTTDDCA